MIKLVDGLSNFFFNYSKVVLKNPENITKMELLKHNVIEKFLIEDLELSENQLNQDKENIKTNFEFRNNRFIPRTEKEMSTLVINQEK